MSEQGEAGVNRFLDDLDDQRDEAASESERRRQAEAAPPQWEYLFWFVGRLNKRGPELYAINGETRLRDGSPSLAALLADAGVEGWELVGTISDGDGSGTLFFKRPLLEA